MTNTVVFLSDLEQLTTLHTGQPHVLKTAHIISLDLDVSAYLNVLGYTFTELMDYISAPQLERLYREAQALRDSWHLVVAAEAQYEGVNPLIMERMILTYFFRDALLAVHLFRAVFARFKFEHIVLFASAHKPFNNGVASLDVRSGIWRFMSEAQNLKIVTIDATDVEKRSWKTSLARLRAAANLLLKSATNPLQWELLKHRLFKKRQPTIAFVLTTSEAYRYAYVVKELKARFKDRFLSLILGARRQGSLYIPQHDVLYYPFGLVPGLSLFKARAFARRLYILWKQRIKAQGTPYPEILNNPYLDFQFEFFFHNQVPNTLENFRQAQTIFRILKTAVVLTTPSGHIYQAAILEAARRQNIPTALIPHSASPEGKDDILSGDYVIVWSKDYINQWRSQGIEEDRIFVTGLPRSLVDDGFRLQAAPPAAHPPDETEKKTVLLLLATASASGVPIVDLRAHLESLKQVVQIPAHLKGKVKLVFKLHPAFDYQYLYQQLATDDVEIVREGNLAHFIRTTDVSVLVNVPTSAYLLALYEKKPLLLIRTSPCFQCDIGLTEHGEEALITRDSEIWVMLERVLFSPPDRERLLQANQRYMRWMGLDNATPLDTLAHAIETIAQR